MKFLSLCSGIDAASVALCPLKWEAVAFSEIEPFPCAVLAHIYPNVPNLGDMTKWREWPEELLMDVEAVLGGTPCQAFSVAGLRGSLTDDRGNLTLIYVEIANHIDAIRARHGRPPTLQLWENVPGVLSTGDNAFGCFLAGLAGEDVPLEPPRGRWTDAGYVRGPARAIAWRILCAQYFGLPQRRERVFVVAGAGAFRPEEVLFESEGVRRDSPPSREKGKGTSYDVAPCLAASGRGFERPGDSRGQDCVIAEPITTRPYQDGGGTNGNLIPDIARCDTSGEGFRQDWESCTIFPTIAHSLRAEGFDASEDGTGRGTPLVPVAFNWQGGGVQTTLGFNPESDIAGALQASQTPAIAFSCKDHGADASQEISPTLRSIGHDGSHANGGGQMAICFDTTQITSKENRSNPQPGDPCHPLAAGAHAPAVAFNMHKSGNDASSMGISEEKTDCLRAFDKSPFAVMPPGMAVRRLTPRECERLQGFPDDYTLIPWRGKPADQCPDGPRYRALGNSWPVPVVTWIGRRINAHPSPLPPD